MNIRILLICGILASVFYFAMNIYVPMLYPGYDVSSQTVSELSAIGAPTRPLWTILIIPYSLLATAFGWGVWVASKGNRPLSIAAALLIIHPVIGIFWPPMHTREVLAAGGGTVSDTLHIVWTAITVLLMLFSIAFAAGGLGKKFRVYSVITIVVLLLFGILTGMDSPRMEKNLSTPRMGIWERISIAAYMTWVIVLAMVLLRKEKINNSPPAG